MCTTVIEVQHGIAATVENDPEIVLTRVGLPRLVAQNKNGSHWSTRLSVLQPVFWERGGGTLLFWSRVRHVDTRYYYTRHPLSYNQIVILSVDVNDVPHCTRGKLFSRSRSRCTLARYWIILCVPARTHYSTHFILSNFFVCYNLIINCTASAIELLCLYDVSCFYIIFLKNILEVFELNTFTDCNIIRKN